MEKKRIYKSLVLPALAVLLVAGFLIWKLPGLRAERAEEPSAEPAAAEATEAPVTAPPEPEAGCGRRAGGLESLHRAGRLCRQPGARRCRL